MLACLIGGHPLQSMIAAFQGWQGLSPLGLGIEDDTFKGIELMT